jgi:acyl-ACP thioesterase
VNKELIIKWAGLLSKKLGRSEAEIEERGLSAYDFSSSTSVEIYYSESSIIKFDSAFLVIDEESRMAAVFTEHYGYYEYSVYGAVAKEISVSYYVDEDFEGAVT